MKAERDALLDKVRDYGGRMTDEQSSTLAEIDEAIDAAPTEAKPAQDAVDAELWRLAVRKGIVTLHSERIDERNQRTRCSWMEGHAKACDISNGAHDAARASKGTPL